MNSFIMKGKHKISLWRFHLTVNYLNLSYPRYKDSLNEFPMKKQACLKCCPERSISKVKVHEKNVWSSFGLKNASQQFVHTGICYYVEIANLVRNVWRRGSTLKISQCKIKKNISVCKGYISIGLLNFHADNLFSAFASC